MKNKYDIEFMRQDMLVLQARIERLEADNRDLHQTLSVVLRSLADNWERLGIVSESLFPGLGQAEAEVNRLLGIEPGTMPSTKGDRTIE
jgi:hypothetical protein